MSGSVRSWLPKLARRQFIGRGSRATRNFTSCRRTLQQPATSSNVKADDASQNIPTHRYGSKPRSRHSSSVDGYPDPEVAKVGITLDGKDGPVHRLSAILLRDLCSCQSCVDPSTNQKNFATAEIPASISARAVSQDEDTAAITWDSDIPGFGEDHTTYLSLETLRRLTSSGIPPNQVDTSAPVPQVTWDAEAYSTLPDIEYEAYMEDDASLFKALHQLHTHGLLFLKNVPESEKSVSTIAERIGPLKNTFYGYTWDVRSVPEAKNVAYTSQHLGFHMDLLYMHQPPHLQFLHCIRSSSAGGASLFTDSYKAAVDLFNSDFSMFDGLSRLNVNFQYNHPSSALYHQVRNVIELGELQYGGTRFSHIGQLKKALERKQKHFGRESIDILPLINAVNWSPPFQAPFSLGDPYSKFRSQTPPGELLSEKIDAWHAVASKFHKLIHRPEGIYERMMRPGECVIFDNRRVLHARKAFEVGDAGMERWLRGAYLDKDPYLSKMRFLRAKFGNGGVE